MLGAPISRSRTSARGSIAAIAIALLHRMHREIDRARQQRPVELLGPQGLAADLGERDILDTVAGRLDRHDLDRVDLPAMCGAQRVAHHIGLDERERRSARAEFELGVRHEPSLPFDAIVAKRPGFDKPCASRYRQHHGIDPRP